MKKFRIIAFAVCMLLLQGCSSMKTEYTTSPYSIAYADVKELYRKTVLSADNINNYYEFVTKTTYNETIGCNQYHGYLKPKPSIYTCIDENEIQISYTCQQNTYNCTYDARTGNITYEGQPIKSQTIERTEYLNPYFSMYPGMISVDYRNDIAVTPDIDENSRYQQITLTVTENFVLTDATGTLAYIEVNDSLPWLYTHKAHDAFYGRGTYKFLQIDAKGGYCTLLFSKDNRCNVSAKYFFDDGTSHGSLGMDNILDDEKYGSIVTEYGQKYILE